MEMSARLLAKKAGWQVLAATETFCSPVVGQFVQGSVRQQGGIGLQEAGVASVGMVEKVSPAASAGFGEASLLGGPLAGRVGSGGGRQHHWGGAACWIGRLAQQGPPDAVVTTEWTQEDEELVGTRRSDPAHQATWEAFMVLLAIRHFVTAGVRGRIVSVGDALGVWFGMVEFCARAGKINEIAKEAATHVALLGQELVEVHIWSEANTVADALGRVAESGVVPGGPRQCAA